jgi:hypothetical protein
MRVRNSVPVEARNRIPRQTPPRRERLEIGVPLTVLAVTAHIPASTLSKFERGLVELTPAEEERRRSALCRLALEAGDVP